MNLHELGYNDEFEKARCEQQLEAFEMARVIAEHKERYTVLTANAELNAEVTGNLRFTARNREDFPAVGDWVALLPHDNDSAFIYSILNRTSALARQAVGKAGEKQLIATNVDYALLLQSAKQDFNLNRLERYLSLCYESKVKPIILLTKIDLINQLEKENLMAQIKQRIHNVPMFAISNETKEGIEDLTKLIEKGKTYCLLGSSGVGKSTLTNHLTENANMKTDAISTSTNKGRHVTTHRELFVLDNGGLLIDNPGMREIGMIDASTGISATFDELVSYAADCKYRDCTHTTETGCAVIQAVNEGNLDANAYVNYQKLAKEKEHFDLSQLEKRQKDKAFGKMIKNVKSDMKSLGGKHKDF